MNLEDYESYSLRDFLEDDFFIHWVINPNNENNAFWKSFMDAFPEKRAIIDDAANFIRTYRSQDTYSNETAQERVWEQIESALNEPVPVRKAFSIPVFMRIAAAFILMAGFGAAYWLAHRKMEITTAYGEVRTVTLPDQSVVVLNGNSTLSYNQGWGKTQREVWINGEGYFRVKHVNLDTLHIKPSERFVVHCPDMNIEVLGTSFNVHSRHNKTDVGLITGKIKLVYFNGNPEKKPVLVMKPGDYIEYAHKNIEVQKKIENPMKIASWVKHELIFSDVSLQRIVETLQDDYGYHVTLSDPSLAKLRIEGEISVGSINELLETINTTLHIDATQNEKEKEINLNLTPTK